jgi:hypothetical protein
MVTQKYSLAVGFLAVLQALTPSAAAQQFVIEAEEQFDGSCGLPVDFSSTTKPLIALGESDFGGVFKTPQCGRSIMVTGPNGSVVGTVISKCGARCVPGTIELSKAFAQQINPQGPGQNGTFAVHWNFVSSASPSNSTGGAPAGAPALAPAADTSASAPAAGTLTPASTASTVSASAAPTAQASAPAGSPNAGAFNAAFSGNASNCTAIVQPGDSIDKIRQRLNIPLTDTQICQLNPQIKNCALIFPNETICL